MQSYNSIKLVSSTTLIFVYCLLIITQLLPSVVCFSYDHDHHQSASHRLKSPQLSPQMISHITVHGLLLWVSMGFLMPVGILTIRISGKEQRDSTRAKVFFYLHVIFQTLSVLVATAGAVMSIRNLENTFNNSHQRLGLALYPSIWIQVMIGFFRPQRGKKGRKVWYFVHWILGTVVSLVGIINIYTGIEAYHKRTMRSTRLWTLLFTTEVALIAFFYLFQDKFEYMQKQALPSLEPLSPHHQQLQQSSNIIILHNPINNNNNNNNKDHHLVPQPCAKRNALRNLFD